MVCNDHRMLASVQPTGADWTVLAMSSQGWIGHAIEGGETALQPGLQAAVDAVVVDDSPSCGASLPAASSDGTDAPSGSGGYNLRKRCAQPIDAVKLMAAASRKRPRVAAKGSGDKGPGKAGEEGRHQPPQDDRSAYALELAREMVAGMAPKTVDEVLGILSSLGVATAVVEHVCSHL